MVRKKVIKHFRHIVPVFAAMLLLVAFASPASAAVSGTWFSPIQFDEVGFLYGEAFERSYRMPYVGGSVGSVYPDEGYTSMKDSMNDLDNLQEVLSVTADGGQVSVITYFSYDYSGWGLGLFARNGFALSTDALRFGNYNITFSQESLPITGSLSLSFTLSKIVESGGSYSVENKTFSVNNYPFMTTSVNLLRLMYNNITDISYISTDYCWISSMDLRFFFDDTEISEVQMLTTYDRLVGVPTASAWVNSYNLPRSVIVNPADPSAVNFTAWLQTAIGGFLDFNIWPGMSLSELLWIILCAGVLFWFLKLTI